jgi:acyl carrier protein
MTTADITREEILAVYPKVAQIMANSLGCDVEQVELDVSLIEGLNAESIDFLDIVFSLERAFKVKIPRGKIVEDARGDLPETAFEEKGYLTDAGLNRLREYLSEVPADRFRSPLRVADITRLLTPETFCKIVARGLRAGPRAPNTDA